MVAEGEGVEEGMREMDEVREGEDEDVGELVGVVRCLRAKVMACEMRWVFVKMWAPRGSGK